MILGLFRRSSSEAVVQRLYAALVAASRQPSLYADLGVPDTFEGRFESLTLHAALLVRRLQACAAPGPQLAQDLTDTVFAHFDRTLREMGVGDTTVPKRMRTLAEAFLGRSRAYEEALRGGDEELAATLARNVAARDTPGLARYVAASVEALARQPLQGFIDGELPFPNASAVPAHAGQP
ncbi:Ubiquinol-cytochrome c chaperone [Beijerinckiaceae bacterium RH AL1]|nr:ubiquinol-cytochrome c chaperone [Beijerinckiaceae bacterium]VVB45224.1 Ubiquinol-cytochrome c chaperone [Beijerinckiaceae bacterium RH CH11]VVB45302.1 Ubiquinol-cytochrome c chaperone [Beijerinckiaceae bacterium RH AL8]VVC54758.1 Ubiquinol-cytochrome c chaperone [Beijerinckiaceae bacterium RH AL1]